MIIELVSEEEYNQLYREMKIKTFDWFNRKGTNVNYSSLIQQLKSMESNKQLRDPVIYIQVGDDNLEEATDIDYDYANNVMIIHDGSFKKDKE